jgi:hypothetical protein
MDVSKVAVVKAAVLLFMLQPHSALAESPREPASVVPVAAEGARVAPASTGSDATKYEFQTYFDFGSQWDSAGGTSIGARSFGAKPGFMLLNAAELSVKATRGPLSARVDLAAGENVDVLTPFVASQNENLRYLTQAYLSYAIDEMPGWSVNAGKMYTHMGYELTRSKDNWIYTRGLLFSYGIPFWHQGASLTGPIVDGALSGGLFVYNGWDGRTSADQNRSVTVGANLALTSSPTTVLTYNYIGGPEQADPSSRRDVHELIAGYNGSDFGLILDAIAGQEMGSTVAGKWQAYSLYSKVALSERTRLVGRYEIFDDRDSGLAVAGALSATGAARQYQSVTLGLNRDLSGGLELRFEARQDIADQSSTLFKDSSGASTSHQETFSLGLLFSL